MSPSSSSNRRRGGQPGNQNACKHGFYASQYPSSAQDEDDPPSIDLQAEIDFIRQSMQRVIGLGEPQTYRYAVDYLRALSLAAAALSRRVRTHRYINPALKEVYIKLEAGELGSAWLACHGSIAVLYLKNRAFCKIPNSNFEFRNCFVPFRFFLERIKSGLTQG